jgi:succinate dehydrogenase hydrophobic anchor subunit
MSNGNQPTTADVYRARVTAVIFAFLTVLSLIFLVYAFIQKTHAEMTMERAAELEEQLIVCQEELQELKSNQIFKP